MEINQYFAILQISYIYTCLVLNVNTYNSCEWDVAISQTFNFKTNTSLTAMHKVGDPLLLINNITVSKLKKQKYLVNN